MAISTHHEASKELFRGKLSIWHQQRTIPKHQCDGEEGKWLGDCEQQVAPGSRSVGIAKGHLKALAVKL
jgi:hypothetical protein